VPERVTRKTRTPAGQSRDHAGQISEIPQILLGISVATGPQLDHNRGTKPYKLPLQSAAHDFDTEVLVES